MEESSDTSLKSEILDCAPVTILVTDLSGTIEYINRFGSALTGYSEQEVLGQNFLDLLVDPSDRAEAELNLQRMLEGDRDRKLVVHAENSVLYNARV